MKAILILAAGVSSRMGQAKQLLRLNDETLLNRMIRLARSSPFEEFAVVLGARSEQIIPTLASDVSFCMNEHWEKGMASSLACGLDFVLEKNKACTHLLVLLVDQPYVDQSLIHQYYEASHKYPDRIIAAYYNAIYGVPALFPARFFSTLSNNSGKAGARKLLKTYADELISIDFPEGALDMDTPEDWQAFLRSKG